MKKKINFQLSIHAIEAIEERNISIKWIEQVLHSPQKIKSHDVDPELKQFWGEIPELDMRVLHVVVNDSIEPIKVVTVHIDRRMRENYENTL